MTAVPVGTRDRPRGKLVEEAVALMTTDVNDLPPSHVFGEVPFQGLCIKGQHGSGKATVEVIAIR